MQTNTSQKKNEQAELTPLTEAELSLVSGGVAELSPLTSGIVDSVQAKEIPTWPPVIRPN
jgi:hypothetical protein